MILSDYILTNANNAVARVAYKTNEVFPIYPITPTSEISELVEKWNAKGHLNIFDNPTIVNQMQGEGGVAGTMHGALQSGCLSSTFTSSQGLLLMIPNMYRIAAELLPNVIHVATRSLATQSLSIFCDHSDIMAARSTGYAYLGSASVQEAQDMALISQAATLKSRIPFIHYFDGFRTSHELNLIKPINDFVIKSLIDQNDINEFTERGLTPDNPKIMGTVQGPASYFETRESINSFYNNCPDIVEEKMLQFGNLTGRYYQSFEYHGAIDAKQVIVCMGSSINTVKNLIDSDSGNERKWGCINVRLFRPFSLKYLSKVLPKTCESIIVLDRTKEPGSIGEPLYLDTLSAITQLFNQGIINKLPEVIGGRYGLSSKEFNPNMVNSIFELAEKKKLKNGFTVGIKDDISFKSISVNEEWSSDTYGLECLIYDIDNIHLTNLKSFGSNLSKFWFIQLYKEFNYSKVNSKSLINLRIDKSPIEASYVINKAELFICWNIGQAYDEIILKRLSSNAKIILVNSNDVNHIDANDKALKIIKKKKIKLFQFKKTDNTISSQQITECIINQVLYNEEWWTMQCFAEIMMPSKKVNCDVLSGFKIKEKFKVSEAHVDGVYKVEKLKEELSYYQDDFEDSTFSIGRYVSILTELFGDRLLLANATGESSIIGGNIDRMPWRKDKNGRGPVWTNSLFEDNAEFGFGFHISQKQKQQRARNLLNNYLDKLPKHIISGLLENPQLNDLQINNQRNWVSLLKNEIVNFPEVNNSDISNLDSLVKKTIWIVGGDGWAYDIGFGGLDHVLASGENLNIMVFDNEAYSNTGGQSSKASRKGEKMAMAFNGKKTRKKDLGKMALCHNNVFVASIAIGASESDAYTKIKEAEEHNGPSLIIANSVNTFDGHKNDYKNAQTVMVNLGHWPLYGRYSDKSKNSHNSYKMLSI